MNRVLLCAFFNAPNFRKLERHIAFSLFVSVWVAHWVCSTLLLNARNLKFHICQILEEL